MADTPARSRRGPGRLNGYVEAAPVLRLFALGLVPFAFTTMFVAAERVGERVAAPAIVMTVSTVVTIALDLVLVPLMGIDGAGLGWLLAQLVAAAVVGAIMLRRRASGREVVPMPVGTGSEAAAGAVGASAVGAASAGSAPGAASSGSAGSEHSSAAGLPSRAPLAPSGTGPSRH